MGKRHEWNAESITKRLLEIREKYGEVSSIEYDKLKIPDKPSRTSLNKHGVLYQDIFGVKRRREKIVVTSEFSHDNQVKLLTLQNEKLIKENNHQKNINAIFIENCLTAVSKCYFKAESVPKPEKAKHSQEFHAMKSDDQAGEYIDPTWVQGVSEYNIELFVKRMGIWLNKILLFREQDKASLGLNKLVIEMLGDHVEGELIYKGQQNFIDVNLVEQLMTCLKTYVNVILRLAAEFPVIELFCVPGNHGRHGRKGETHPKSNFDYLLFRLMKEALARQENVSVFISESPTMLVRNGRFNFALNHNSDVNSYMGIPYYGLNRKAQRLDSLYGMKIHYKLGGHFHVPSNLGDETIVNGTMVGGSDLSINKMQMACLPSQKIFYFDRDHGIHRESNVYLAEPVVLEPDEHGIYTTHL